jgi:hypothetical protein
LKKLLASIAKNRSIKKCWKGDCNLLHYETKKSGLKKVESMGSYFLGLGLAFAFVGFVSLTVFMGAPQHNISPVSQPHGSSTKTTRPQSSHLYLSPFFFAKNLHLPKTL